MEVVMPLCGVECRSAWPNACNMNWYLDGSSSVGWHADDEPLFQGLTRDACIISLSLGAGRRFDCRLTNGRGAQQKSICLQDGDLMTMEVR